METKMSTPVKMSIGAAVIALIITIVIMITSVCSRTGRFGTIDETICQKTIKIQSLQMVEYSDWVLPGNAKLVKMTSEVYSSDTSNEVYKNKYYYEIPQWVESREFITYQIGDTATGEPDLQENERISSESIIYGAIVTHDDGSRDAVYDDQLSFEKWSDLTVGSTVQILGGRIL